MSDVLTGVVQLNRKGFGFLIPDNEDYDDVFIPKNDLNTALDGDRVRLKITEKAHGDNKAEGRVIEVLERNRTVLIGRFERVKNYGFVILDGKDYGYDIFIPKENRNHAKNGDKVIVEIDYFKKKDKNPTGYIKEVLGNVNDIGIDILAIAKKFELPDEFSPETLHYAQSLPAEVDERDFKGRADFRNLFTVTIDGADSKDFDDAISIDKDKDKYSLYVHIADVTHYVKEKTSINRDALERGNSVYLLDRVIPMLPVELSNNLCSLNPGKDRLAVTVRMDFDKRGEVLDYYFYESVIRSDYRLVYADVSDFLEGKQDVYEDDLLKEKLKTMEELSKILEEKRVRKGNIDFNFKETEIQLDETGYPIKIGVSDRRVANEIIENFMVATNEVVGGHFANMNVSFLYRVHEKPDEEKAREFRKIIAKFGIIIKGQDLYPKDYQKILEKVKGTRQEMLVNKLMLRSLKKADYRREPNIHFGLATENYSHFTAPIRRYSDIVVHRILKRSLHGKFKKEKKSYHKKLDEIAEHVSKTERQAEEAERDVESMKMCEYMKDRIGFTYKGIVSSLNNFGFFVELENTIEGLVHFRNLDDDYYEFDEENYAIVGQLTGKTFKLGQEVEIIVDNVNIELREIDFKLVTHD